MVGWHHRLNGHEFEQAPGVGEGQGSLACCGSRGHKESDTSEPLSSNDKWTDKKEKKCIIGGKGKSSYLAAVCRITITFCKIENNYMWIVDKKRKRREKNTKLNFLFALAEAGACNYKSNI